MVLLILSELISVRVFPLLYNSKLPFPISPNKYSFGNFIALTISPEEFTNKGMLWLS